MALDMPGYKVNEVLVSEGDRVNSGQVLARLARMTGEVLESRPPTGGPRP